MTIDSGEAVFSGGLRSLRTAMVVWRSTEALLPDPDKRRPESSLRIGRLAASILAFGVDVPIVVDSGLRVIEGNGRLAACRRLGWPRVPTIGLDDLDDAHRRALAVAVDPFAENASWNDRLLACELKTRCLDRPDPGPDQAI